MSKFLQVNQVDNVNKFLPSPLILNEIVTAVEYKFPSEDSKNKYVKIIHNKGKSESVFSLNKFKKYTPTSKGELKILLKKKSMMPLKVK